MSNGCGVCVGHDGEALQGFREDVPASCGISMDGEVTIRAGPLFLGANVVDDTASTTTLR